jgi:peptidoglycan/xylan/chitin deacetylase (PgdA/CDA1 family)
MSRPLASLSLDLDNQWSYMKTHGDAGWESLPSYLDLVVPRFLKFLAERDLKITVFVVGQDAALEKNHAALASITAAGHEVGNHSFHHEPWLHLYSEAELQTEIARTDDALEQVCGQRPIGFRGPGFSFSPTLLRVLAERGYQYDCSTFPTFIGPVARLYYFLAASLNREEKSKRKLLFGSWSEVFRPLKPYLWQIGDHRMLEIPVTTMPLVRAPIHLSYLLYLRRYSRFAALAYWRLTLLLCRLTGVEPSILLHPLDFLGCDDKVGLDFFPAMNLTSSVKLALVSDVFAMLSQNYRIVNMAEHAAALASRNLSARRLSETPAKMPHSKQEAVTTT